MGAKASTNGNQNPRTFSNSSSSESDNPASFNFLHGVEVTNDSRQRARSLSAVPELGNTNHSHHSYSNQSNQPYSHIDISGFQNLGAEGSHFEITPRNQDENSDYNNPMPGINALGLSRVYTASLPSHIWSINGKLIWGKPRSLEPKAKPFWQQCMFFFLNYQLLFTLGFKCPVCSKFVLPDDIECHIVICLTKPRLSYNGELNFFF